MENNNFRNKHESQFEVREISDEPLLNRAASLVSEYSWGLDYPLNPLDEIQEAEYKVGAFVGDNLVGFATVGRSFSPDGIDNGELWLAHVVVLPEFRSQGIFSKLYQAQIKYAKNQFGRILSCTDNPIVEKFFLDNNWKEIRQTKDEAGEVTKVFEHKRFV